MRKVLCVLLACMLLTGCSVGLAQHPTETIARSQQLAILSVDELTFTLPGTFELRDTSDFDFFVADGNAHTVLGWKHNKESLGEMTLQQFASQTVSNRKDMVLPLQERDGFWVYSFKTDRGDGGYIMFFGLCLETEDAFWEIQGSCPEEDVETYEDQIWSWLTSVTVNEG